MGIASMLFDKAKLPLFFYVIPFVALAFDLFIIGESFTMKRMTEFIRWIKSEQQDVEFSWEKFVQLNPNKFSNFGNLVITLIATIGSLLILLITHNSPASWFSIAVNVVWLVAAAVTIILIAFLNYRLLYKKWSFPKNLSFSKENAI